MVRSVVNKENYKAYPVIGSKNKSVFSKIDLRETDKYDREKLLLQGFYDAETLKQCLKSGTTDETVVVAG